MTAVTKEHEGGTSSKNTHILRNHKNKEGTGEEKHMRMSERMGSGCRDTLKDKEEERGG